MSLTKELAFYERMTAPLTSYIDGVAQPPYSSVDEAKRAALAEMTQTQYRLATKTLALSMARHLLCGTSMQRLQRCRLTKVVSNTLLRQLANRVPRDARVNQPHGSVVSLRRNLKTYMGHDAAEGSFALILPEQLHLNVILCRNLMKLSAAETALLGFALTLDICSSVRALVGYYGQVSSRSYATIVAGVMGVPETSIRAALMDKSRLGELNLRSGNRRSDSVARMLRLSPSLVLYLHYL